MTYNQCQFNSKYDYLPFRGTVKGLQSVFNKKESSGVSADSKYKTDECKRYRTVSHENLISTSNNLQVDRNAVKAKM